jgi:hypothetical protein
MGTEIATFSEYIARRKHLLIVAQKEENDSIIDS